MSSALHDRYSCRCSSCVSWRFTGAGERVVAEHIEIAVPTFAETVRAQLAAAAKELPPAEPHPIQSVFDAVIQQLTKGKGVRHGGDVTPFLDQPWAHYARMHGRGFLTGQAAKKLEEAASTREGEAFEHEVLGAIVYCAMAILHERGL